MKLKLNISLIIALLCISFMKGQGDSLKVMRNRKIVTASIFAAGTAVSYAGLYQLWYKDYSSGKFHQFNDNSEWLQLDKSGHAFSTYQVGKFAMKAMKWAGYNRTQSIWIGGMSGSAYLLGIEIMDGYSSGWGFSWGDIGSNLGGSLLFATQQQVWNEQRIHLKFSYHETGYAAYRPNLLGEKPMEKLFKDYNGQTYWLSINVPSFFQVKNKYVNWLCLSAGYGGEGMISGEDNFVIVTAGGNVIGNKRYRQYYLSLDIDFSKIRTRSKFLNGVFDVLNCVKFPLPAIEFSNGKVKGHGLYF